MKRSSVVLLVVSLAACGVGGQGASTLLPQSAAVVPVGSLQRASEAQSDALQAPQPLYTPGVNDLLYVGNDRNNSITVYRHDANGNTAPQKVIAGSKTGLSTPGQLSEDAAGNLYVANGFPQPAILVFAHGANGNVAPIRKLTGSHTKLSGGIDSMTVDQTTGKIFAWVTDPEIGDQFNLLRFPPNATGNTEPFATEASAYPSNQLTSDSSGKELINAHPDPCCTSQFIGIFAIAKQFADGSALPATLSTAASTDIYRFLNLGIADDPTKKTFLASGSGQKVAGGPSVPGIYRFAENTTGDFPWGDDPGDLIPRVVSIITSAGATSCGQLSLGYLRNIYAVCGSAINVFTPDASGNAAPLRALKGSATKLNEPFGIYEGQ